MAQTLTLKVSGLATNVNELSTTREGSLLVADNININAEGVAEPRRGFDQVTGTYSDTADRTDAILYYQDKMIVHHGATLGSADTLSYLNSGTFTSLGTYSAPADIKLKHVQANQNLYFTTSAGVYKMDAYNATPKLSGAYKALDMNASVSSSASTWLADAYRTAFRAVWGYVDANNNMILGAPSQRESIKNTAGSQKAIDLKITIPSGATTDWFFQVYRAAAVDNSSTDTEPSDEMGLVYEASPTAGSFSSYSKTFLDADVNTGTETITISSHGFTNGDVVSVSNSGGALPTGLSANTEYFIVGATTNTFQLSATYGGSAINITGAAGGGTYTIKGAQVIMFSDIVPDALRGATIYTAASQEGLAYGNERPPLAKDIATFRDCTFFANVESLERYYLTILAVDGSGLINNDTITIGGITYTGKTAGENITNAEFQVVTTGTAAQDIRDTALSLVRVINRHVSSTVYAYYLSGVDDLPGKILLESRTLGAASFAVTASRGSAFNPALPSSGTAESSTNDEYVNGLFWSKTNQPEAVPLVNFATVGSKDKAIKRIIPLKDSLLVFKEDGIWRVSGYYPSFSVDLIDSSAALIGNETPAILNNMVFCLSTQGIISVGESVSVISLAIEDAIREKIGSNQSGVESLSFGISHETERKYFLHLPTNSASTFCESAFVYNSFTRTFVRHLVDATCGYVGNQNNYYLGDASNPNVLVEKKTNTYADHADYGFTTTIATVSSNDITVGSNYDTIEVGDIIWQSSTLFAAVASKTDLTSTITVGNNPGFTVAACTVLKAIPVEIQWAPVTMGNPAIMKHFHTCEILLRAGFQGTGYVGFTTDIDQSEELVEIEGADIGLWGLFSWGEAEWGGTPVRRALRQWIPRNKQRCTQLIPSFQHSWGYSLFKLQGISLFGEMGSERSTDQ